jgi:serine/threonine protein kinase
MRLKPLVTGGFSSVFLAEVEFSFVDPSRFREEQFLAVKDRKWERNLLVVKREISSGGGAAKRGSRNQHEKDIIDHMKNSVSCMLNRYYFPVNTTELCKNDILMDYIPFPTLKEFLVMSRATLSLQSKLTVMVSIVQGLRSIDRHDVAHLDLKPNNIVLNPDLQIKLLDFG